MLKQLADVRTLAFVASWYGLLAMCWTLPLGWWTVPLVATMCVLSFLCAVITHNTIHVPMFTSRPLNLVFQVVLTLCYGHPVSAYVPGHNLSHHRYIQTRKDVMRTTKLRYRWNLLNQLLFLPGVAPAIIKADMDFARAMYKQRPRWFQQFCIEWAVFIAMNAVMLGLDWQRFLLFIFLPHNYAAWGIVGMNFAQHDGCDVTHPYNHSRNFTGRLVNWLTFNNGLHGIHHLHPNLHWSLAREAHDREIAPFLHPNLAQPNMLVWIWHSFFWPGVRLNYDGTPLVLPEEGPDEDWVTPSSGYGDLGAAG
ncbi:MAG: fatty acid desaturase [Myxococcales bacterium]|nr:fatty acid desaturase [Myxococcales bacterium]